MVVDTPTDKQNDQGWPKQFLGARITGSGLGDDTIGVWAIGDPSPIWALNTMARELSDWGAAAQEGSQAAENRDTLAGYEEADQAEDCVSAR